LANQGLPAKATDAGYDKLATGWIGTETGGPAALDNEALIALAEKELETETTPEPESKPDATAALAPQSEVFTDAERAERLSAKQTTPEPKPETTTSEKESDVIHSTRKVGLR
jgi:hypothetical protein